MKHIPNLFTLLNLVFGFAAVILILQTGETLVMSNDAGNWIAQLPEKIWWGSICIGIAAVIDFLDGFVARLFRAESEIGKQLDSLADVVSFGVAPGLILYQLLRISYIQEETALDTSIWMLAPAVLIPCAGAYRLARYNVQAGTQPGFRGVPIPAAGLFIASLPLILLYDKFGLTTVLVNKWFLYGLIVLLSWLMVSSLPLMALKFRSYGLKENLPAYLLLLIVVLSAVLLGWVAVPVVFAAYLIISLVVAKNKATQNP